jgi:alpha-beta hydrolase superfamily lysophospholipase
MKHQEGHFKGLKDFDIYYQGWLPEGEPRAVLLIAHGMAEHGGRYKNVVNHLVPQGYAAYALDHRGHGKSQGQRVYVERFTHYLDDLKTFFDMVRGWHPELKIFLVGHSMGGTISLAYALRYQDELDGLILSGAGIKIGSSVSPLLILVGKIIAVILPKMGLIVLDASAISRDPETVAAYDNDPLVYRGKVTARLGAELIATLQSFPGQASQLRLPVLILHGGADKLTDPQGSEWLHEVASSTDKTLKVYEGYYHEVFNELGREKVLEDVEGWLAERVSKT